MGAAGGGILQARLRGRGQGQLRHLRGVRGAGAEPVESRGRLGFILPHKFFNAQYGEPLRKLLAGGRHLAEIVHFGDQQVFHAATTYTCLLFLDRAGRDEFRFERVADLAAWREAREVDPKGLADLAGLAAASDALIPADRATAAEWNFTVGAGAALFEKLRAMPVKLGDVASDLRRESRRVPIRFTLLRKCFGERESSYGSIPGNK